MRGARGQSLKARLLSEGLAAHLEHRRELLSDCTFENQVEYIAGPANTRELPCGWTSLVLLTYPSRLFETRYPLDDLDDEISCVNAGYAFRMLRSKDGRQIRLMRYRAEAPIKFLAAGRVDEYKQLSLDQFYVHDALPVLTVNHLPLELFLKHEGLQWNAVRQERADGGEQVILDFTGDVGLYSVRFLAGTIAFSPGRSWAIDEFRMRVVDKQSASPGVFVHKQVGMVGSRRFSGASQGHISLLSANSVSRRSLFGRVFARNPPHVPELGAEGVAG